MPQTPNIIDKIIGYVERHRRSYPYRKKFNETRINGISRSYEAALKSIRKPLACLLFKITDPQLINELKNKQGGNYTAAKLSFKGLLRYIFMYYAIKSNQDFYLIARYAFGSSRRSNTFASRIYYDLVQNKKELENLVNKCSLCKLNNKTPICRQHLKNLPVNVIAVRFILNNVEISCSSYQSTSIPLELKDIITSVLNNVKVNGKNLFENVWIQVI
ncbi:MAG: hypothetical protein ACTSXX_06430 [Candidatus Baldrarchaeia archaeon]